jgi:hypothetical protein
MKVYVALLQSKISSKKPTIDSLPSSPHNFINAENSSPNLSPMNNESLYQSIPEINPVNCSILAKNNEHMPKQKIIESIRKFDD